MKQLSKIEPGASSSHQEYKVLHRISVIAYSLMVLFIALMGINRLMYSFLPDWAIRVAGILSLVSLCCAVFCSVKGGIQNRK